MVQILSKLDKTNPRIVLNVKNITGIKSLSMDLVRWQLDPSEISRISSNSSFIRDEKNAIISYFCKPSLSKIKKALLSRYPFRKINQDKLDCNYTCISNSSYRQFPESFRNMQRYQSKKTFNFQLICNFTFINSNFQMMQLLQKELYSDRNHF